MITCPLCNTKFKVISNSHLKSHGYDHQLFKEKFPTYELQTAQIRKACGSQSVSTREKIKRIQIAQLEGRIAQYNLAPVICQHCGGSISYEKRINKFCSHHCSAASANKTRTRKPLSSETKDKLRSIAKKNLKKQHAKDKKVFIKQCPICGITFKLDTYTRLKKCCSNKCKREHHSRHNCRTNLTKGRCGRYKGIWCASSWELAFLVFNMENGSTPMRYNGSFEYLNTVGKRCRYFPDFIMDGVIYEIKGQMTDDVPLKIACVEKAGFHICLLTRTAILPMIDHIKQHYSIKDITVLYDFI